MIKYKTNLRQEICFNFSEVDVTVSVCFEGFCARVRVPLNSTRVWFRDKLFWSFVFLVVPAAFAPVTIRTTGL